MYFFYNNIQVVLNISTINYNYLDNVTGYHKLVGGSMMYTVQKVGYKMVFPVAY